MKSLITQFNLALSILEENFMRMLCSQEEALCLITSTRDLTNKSKRELMRDLTNTNRSRDKHQSQLMLKFRKIWYRDMQSGLEVVSWVVQNISQRFVIAEKTTWREDHQFAGIILYSLQDFEGNLVATQKSLIIRNLSY